MNFSDVVAIVCDLFLVVALIALALDMMKWAFTGQMGTSTTQVMEKIITFIASIPTSIVTTVLNAVVNLITTLVTSIINAIFRVGGNKDANVVQDYLLIAESNRIANNIATP